MGIIPKAAKFLGIEKFGKGLASAGRVISGHVNQDVQNQQNVDVGNEKVVYALKKEKDPVKKKQLEQFLQRQQFGNADPNFHSSQEFANSNVQANQIDPGLKLSDREILGSAANVALNVATPGAFKGGKAAVLAKNVALGGAFGAASGLEKNRSASGIIGSTVGGALVGGAIGGTGLLAKAAKDFIGVKTPEWIMNKAVKPALQDLRKNVKYGTATLGKELLDEGVKGGPKKLLQIADTKLTLLENDLQKILAGPGLEEARITRKQIIPYAKDLIKKKLGTPGLQNEANRIKEIVNSMPDQMTLQEANQMKRRIYDELRDPAYKLDAKLSVKSSVLKVIAKGLKTEIENTVGGTVVKDINHKLSIYGRLENSMVDQLARNMRNNGVSLTDAILLAGGDTTSILALLRHIGQGAETHIAQGLSKVSKIGTGPVGRTSKNLIKRAALNAP